ncbi:unnamed protein product [Peniophora sp. CBMAI 1063]|nr:unnamed protein product [Peniophora sp. CBMAI 1063]
MAFTAMSGSPAQSLPHEILLSIFTILTILRPITHYPGRFRPGWTVVTHVCRLWREAALNSGGILWAESISIFPDTALEEILRRAKRVPLSLNLDDICLYPGDAMMEHLLRRSKRVRVGFYSRVPTYLWLAQLAEQARPELKQLVLHENPQSRIIAPYFAEDFVLQAPALTHCTLSRCVPLAAHKLRALRIDSAWEGCPVHEVLRYLSAFPLLEDLHLCLKEAISYPVPEAPFELRLESLRSFVNASTDCSVVALLPRLHVPSTTDLSFILDLKADDLAGVEEMRNELLKLCLALSHSCRSETRPHNTLVWDLRCPVPYLMRFTLCDRHSQYAIHQDDGLQARPGGTTQIQISGGCPNMWPFGCISRDALTDLLSAQPITTLCIPFFGLYGGSDLELDDAYEPLKGPGLRNVTELIVHRPSHHFFSLLSRPQALDSSFPLILPKLSRIVIDTSFYGQTLMSESEAAEFAIGNYHNCKWISQLRKALAHRVAMSDRKLNRLTFKGEKGKGHMECASRFCERLTGERMKGFEAFVCEVRDDRV